MDNKSENLVLINGKWIEATPEKFKGGILYECKKVLKKAFKKLKHK